MHTSAHQPVSLTHAKDMLNPSDEAVDQVVNLAGYVFASLDEPEARVTAVGELCLSLGLKGSVILSPEGVNLSLAGSREATAAVQRDLPKLLGLATIPCKVSYSASQPFARMRVKCKARLLPVGDLPWDAQLSSTTQLPAATLAAWLDEGREVVLVDTRNDYEYDMGSFVGAVRLPIDEFADFAAQARERHPEWRDKTIVTFCTGGIRCEKAVPLMVRQLGYDKVYQLEGGILQYFEDVGGRHWWGDCFVFDQRVGLSPELQARPRPICPDCGKPAMPATEACPYCGSERGAWAGHGS